MTVGPGQTLSHYRVVDEISRGGMGVVYRAVDLHLNREVALKILPADLVSDSARRERFVHEAQAASALEHPHIAVIHEISEDQGVCFIAMELIRGEKLADLVGRGPLAPSRALDLGAEIVEALARAHDRGIIHRDLKPSNVMITEDGHAKVIDFGLAKLVAPLAGDPEHETTIAGDTDPGMVLGTVSYMSPEQARGGRIDHRTDIFTFGIVLHEMLVGEPPFRTGSGIETLHSIMTQAPAPLPPLSGTASPDAVAEIQRIRDKCLAKEPEDRYQGMRDLIVDLRAARRRLESAAFAAPRSVSGRRPRLALAAAAGVAGIALAGVAVWLKPPEPQAGPQKPSVAVLYFENNTGNPSLDWLRTGLTDMLVTDLSQSSQIEVLSTDRLYEILSQLQRADDRAVSADVVREIAQRAGVQTVLVGSYVKAGEAIRINVKLQEATSGRILGADRVEALGEEHLFRTVDDLTRRVRSKLELPAASAPSGLFVTSTTVSSDPAGMDRDLKEVTTASIEAYRYYAEAINLHERFREEQAIPLFEKALSIDPTFALAMAKLGVVHSNLGHPTESDEYFARALKHVDRVTARERFYIEGQYYSRRRETIPRALEVYAKGLALYPDHASLRHNLALLYAQLERSTDAINHYEELRKRGMTFPGTHSQLAFQYAARREFPRALQVLDEYIRRNPDIPVPHHATGAVLTAAGKLDEAYAAYARALQLDPAFTPALMGQADVHLLRDEWGRAAEYGQRIIRSEDSFRRWRGHTLLATIALYRGQGADALAELDRAAAAYPRRGPNSAATRARAAFVLLEQGRAAEALALAAKAVEEADGRGVESVARHAKALAEARLGRVQEAEDTVADLKRRAAAAPGVGERRRAHMAEGDLALSRRDLGRSMRELSAAEKLLPAEVLSGPMGATAASAPIWFSLASVELQARQLSDAERWLQRIATGTTARLQAPIEFVRSFYLLGTIYEARGERDRAREAYQRFLAYWGDGDMDRDRVAEVRRKLGGT